MENVKCKKQKKRDILGARAVASDPKQMLEQQTGAVKQGPNWEVFPKA